MLKGVILTINVLYFLLFFSLGFTQLFPRSRRSLPNLFLLWSLGVPGLITAIYLVAM